MDDERGRAGGTVAPVAIAAAQAAIDSAKLNLTYTINENLTVSIPKEVSDLEALTNQ